MSISKVIEKIADRKFKIVMEVKVVGAVWNAGKPVAICVPIDTEETHEVARIGLERWTEDTEMKIIPTSQEIGETSS